ncbi:MAG: ABC transporter substrate-binding protein [Pyrobaculum sp.]
MWKILGVVALVAAVAILLAAFYISQTATAAGQPTAAGCPKDVLVYAAPTLVRLGRDVLTQAGSFTAGLLSIGSVEAVKRISQGAVPDLYLSVDIELAKEVERALEIYPLGRFRISLVCRKPLGSPQELARLRTALSDPSKAPIGYRELALVWMLYRDGWADLLGRYRELGIGFVESGGVVNITTPIVLPSTSSVAVAPNLDASWTLFETGGVDCVFAHTPFLMGRVELGEAVASTGLWTIHRGQYGRDAVYVHIFKPPYDFFDDPPYEIYINFVDSGRLVRRLKVIHFEAFAAAFSQKGACILDVIKKMELGRYGIYR